MVQRPWRKCYYHVGYYGVYRAASVTGVKALAIYCGAIQLKYRESRNSFTQLVIEVYFDDCFKLLGMLDFLENWMNTFLAVRVINDTIAYISVPVFEDH